MCHRPSPPCQGMVSGSGMIPEPPWKAIKFQATLQATAIMMAQQHNTHIECM